MTQPTPMPNTHPAVADLVINDLTARKEFGTRLYGTPLQPFNGRNALLDAYEEALDLCCYLKQALLEQETQS